LPWRRPHVTRTRLRAPRSLRVLAIVSLKAQGPGDVQEPMLGKR
jgi:hypothetical protein